MTTFFVFCAALGGGVLVLQLVASLVGVDHGGHDAAHTGQAEQGEGLDLYSLRAIAAGAAAFGLAGYGVLAAGAPGWAAVVAGALAAFAAAAAVAAVMRTAMRLESDGTVRIEQALGRPAVVYLRVPGERQGAGKVHITLQNRTVELQAVTRQLAQLPTGADVVVVDVVGPDTVEVVATPSLED